MSKQSKIVGFFTKSTEDSISEVEKEAELLSGDEKSDRKSDEDDKADRNDRTDEDVQAQYHQVFWQDPRLK
jgi:hypothetical protein